MDKYSAEAVKAKAAEMGATQLLHHDCGICGVWTKYLIRGESVGYQSACGCSWSEPRPSSFADISAWLAMQKSDDHRDNILSRMS